jgi:hypothetical protein
MPRCCGTWPIAHGVAGIQPKQSWLISEKRRPREKKTYGTVNWYFFPVVSRIIVYFKIRRKRRSLCHTLTADVTLDNRFVNYEFARDCRKV